MTAPLDNETGLLEVTLRTTCPVTVEVVPTCEAPAALATSAEIFGLLVGVSVPEGIATTSPLVVGTSTTGEASTTSPVEGVVSGVFCESGSTGFVSGTLSLSEGDSLSLASGTLGCSLVVVSVEAEGRVVPSVTPLEASDELVVSEISGDVLGEVGAALGRLLELSEVLGNDVSGTTATASDGCTSSALTA